MRDKFKTLKGTALAGAIGLGLALHGTEAQERMAVMERAPETVQLIAAEPEPCGTLFLTFSPEDSGWTALIWL